MRKMPFSAENVFLGMLLQNDTVMYFQTLPWVGKK